MILSQRITIADTLKERSNTMAEYIEREKLLRDIEHYHVSDGKFQHWVEIQLASDVAPVVHGEWIGKPIAGYSKC